MTLIELQNALSSNQTHISIQFYSECSCILPSGNSTSPVFEKLLDSLNETMDFDMDFEEQKLIGGGTAITGSCPIDCQREFILFLTVMCLLKFTGATGRASNFLVSVR